MTGDKKEVEGNSGSKTAVVATMFMLSTAALGYVLGDTLVRKHNVSKAHFICTKIEQVGKNMDDVVCVQYTHQKFHKEAVALNKLN